MTRAISRKIVCRTRSSLFIWRRRLSIFSIPRPSLSMSHFHTFTVLLHRCQVWRICSTSNTMTYYPCLPACLSVCLPVCLTVCLSVYLSSCLSVCPSVCLLVCQSSCLLVWFNCSRSKIMTHYLFVFACLFFPVPSLRRWHNTSVYFSCPNSKTVSHCLCMFVCLVQW